MSTVCARPALSESAYQPMWNTVLSAADTPAVQWADGCDFIGSNAIGFQPGSWAAGCMILCENDPQCTHVSADGTVTRVRNNNRMGKIVLTYGQNATALDTLSAINHLDEASGTGARMITVEDGNGRSIATAPQSWLAKPPDAEYQKEATTREWSFDCDHLTHKLGGLT